MTRSGLCPSVLLAGLLALALAGCGQTPNAPVLKKGDPKDLPSFKEGKGFFLPEETRQSIGLEVAEVTDQKIHHQVHAQAQLFEVTPDGLCRASGLLGQDGAQGLQPGQTLLVAQEGDQSITGKLSRINPEPLGAPGQVEFIIEFPATSKANSVGSFFSVTATTTNAEAETAVPASALLRAAQGDFVYVVNGERLLRTPVKVGEEGQAFVQIKDGLYAGDKVAIKPVELLWLTELRLSTAGGDSD